MLVHPARRAHHDVRAMFQRCELRAKRGAAAEREHFHVGHPAGETAQLFRHLIRQFTGGTQY